MASSIFGASGQQSRKKSDPAQKLAEIRKFAAGITPQSARQQVMQMLTGNQLTKQQFQEVGREADEIIKQMFR